MKEKITVIFRVGKEGEVFALFPYLASDRCGYYCTSYQHVGQHSAADYTLCIANSRPAKPTEYADLAAELKQIGYDFVIRKRKFTRKVK